MRERNRRVGIDVVGVNRVALAIERTGERFLRKVYTPAELAHCAGDAERLAGRWAAKEAVIKCLDGTGVNLTRGEIEVLPNAAGAPIVHLLGRWAATQDLEFEISITHHSGLAVAAATMHVRSPEELLDAPPPQVDLPLRPPAGHKGTFGTAVVLAGSLGMTGAAYLSAMAAARSGTGITRLLTAESIYPILANKCTEVMATPISEVAPGAVGHAGFDGVMRHFRVATAGLVGPGLGRDRSTWRLVDDLALQAACPLVIDADGLNALGENRRLLTRLPGNRVLTPHPGEMSRLTGQPTPPGHAERLELARRCSREWGAVVVLKGAGTVVAAPDGECVTDDHAVPALGSGGTGDVLAGVITGLIAQGMAPFTAAVTAVYVHAEAGRRLSDRIGEAGVLASDLLPEIPVILAMLRRGAVRETPHDEAAGAER